MPRVILAGSVMTMFPTLPNPLEVEDAYSSLVIAFNHDTKVWPEVRVPIYQYPETSAERARIVGHRKIAINPAWVIGIEADAE